MNTSEKPTRNLLPFICKAIALAAGIAVLIMSILHTLTFDTQAALLGLGLALLALASLTNQASQADASQG